MSLLQTNSPSFTSEIERKAGVGQCLKGNTHRQTTAYFSSLFYLLFTSCSSSYPFYLISHSLFCPVEALPWSLWQPSKCGPSRYWYIFFCRPKFIFFELLCLLSSLLSCLLSSLLSPLLSSLLSPPLSPPLSSILSSLLSLLFSLLSSFLLLPTGGST